jgi:hypothetical protein
MIDDDDEGVWDRWEEGRKGERKIERGRQKWRYSSRED